MNHKLQVALNDSEHSGHPPWLLSSVAFARECLPAIAAGSRGPVVLCGLPVDFTFSLALAAWYCGRPIAFIDPALAPQQQRLMQESLQPALWITASTPLAPLPEQTQLLDLEADTAGQVFEAWLDNSNAKECQPAYCWSKNDTAIVLYTSGSTGLPKGVCHSLHNLLFSAELFRQQFTVEKTDKLLNLAPLHTMSGLRGSVFIPLLTGCDVHVDVIPTQLVSILRALEEEESSVLIVGPVLLQTLSKITERLVKLNNLRLILCTGAGLARDVRQQLWPYLNAPVLDYYGLTETCGLVIAESHDDYRPEQKALGRACNNIKAVVLDKKGKEAQHGIGELRIYSPALYLGYWGQALSQPSYFDTHDRVNIDEDGWIFYLGRMGRGVKSTTTTWLYPEAVENWLSTHPAIEDFAVTTIADSSAGVIQGYVVSEEEICHKTLTEQLCDVLGSEYQTTQWRTVKSIPRTALSKIQWTELDDHEATK